MARRLLLLNGLAIVGVVLNHSAAWVFIAMFWWTDRYRLVTVPDFDKIGSLAYYSLRIVEQVIAFSVPAFLFVSGFFVAFAAARSQSEVRWRVTWSRIGTLLVPYLVWSGVALLGDYAAGVQRTPAQIASLFLFGRAADPFYFVPLLCQLYLLSPFLLTLARQSWKPLLLAVFAVQLAVQGLRYFSVLGAASPAVDALIDLTPNWLFVSKAGWFVAGAVAALHLPALAAWLARFKWVVLGLCLAFLALGVLEWELLLRLSGQDWIGYHDTSLDSLYAGAFILAFLAFDRIRVPMTQTIAALGSKSYGIYLIHALALTYTARLLYHVAPMVLAHEGLLMITLCVIGLGMPLGLMAIVKRSPTRPLYSYLFG
ncbi:MAG: acyltransferase [Anaerolineales bacterium]|nr:acyltransferase [Anaerolineales bacterium]